MVKILPNGTVDINGSVFYFETIAKGETFTYPSTMGMWNHTYSKSLLGGTDAGYNDNATVTVTNVLSDSAENLKNLTEATLA